MRSFLPPRCCRLNVVLPLWDRLYWRHLLQPGQVRSGEGIDQPANSSRLPWWPYRSPTGEFGSQWMSEERPRWVHLREYKKPLAETWWWASMKPGNCGKERYEQWLRGSRGKDWRVRKEKAGTESILYPHGPKTINALWVLSVCWLRSVDQPGNAKTISRWVIGVILSNMSDRKPRKWLLICVGNFYPKSGVNFWPHSGSKHPASHLTAV